jgi:hypothetical protein
LRGLLQSQVARFGSESPAIFGGVEMREIRFPGKGFSSFLHAFA